LQRVVKENFGWSQGSVLSHLSCWKPSQENSVWVVI